MASIEPKPEGIDFTRGPAEILSYAAVQHALAAVTLKQAEQEYNRTQDEANELFSWVRAVEKITIKAKPGRQLVVVIQASNGGQSLARVGTS